MASTKDLNVPRSNIISTPFFNLQEEGAEEMSSILLKTPNLNESDPFLELRSPAHEEKKSSNSLELSKKKNPESSVDSLNVSELSQKGYKASRRRKKKKKNELRNPKFDKQAQARMEKAI